MHLSFSKVLNATLAACLPACLAACLATTAFAPTASAKTAAARPPAPLRLIDASLTDSQPMGVNLDDLVRYAPNRVRDAKILQALIQNSDARIFQAGETLCGIPTLGVVHKGKAITKPKVDSICGEALLEKAPQLEGDVATYPLAILMQTAQGTAFRKVNVEVSPATAGAREITNVQVQGDILVAQTHFSISVGLVSNIQVLQDVQNDLLITSPIGNGGLSLDTGSTRNILTPMFHGASLRKSAIIPSLGPPVEDYYYRYEPYIAISRANGTVAPIAFHITILSDGLWADGKGANFLMRGYQSHGCMRMREHDLMVLYTLVMGSPNALPVDVDYFASLMDASGKPLGTVGDAINTVQPYPLTHGSYFQEKNQALPGEPATAARDTDPTISHHLVVMESVGGTVPYAKLQGFDGDDEQGLQTYLSLLSKQSANGLKRPVAKKKVVAKKNVAAPVDVTPVAVAPALAPLQ